MNALTICQPYAHLIVIGEKPIENRTWPTNFRGELAIHAGKSRAWLDDGDERRFPNMPFGAIVGVARLVACLGKRYPADYRWPEQYRHLADHQHANGPWCWVLEDVRRLKTPIACRGAQGLWTLPDDVERNVRETLRREREQIDRCLAGESVEALAAANGVTQSEIEAALRAAKKGR